MTPVIYCPACARALGRVEADGRFQATCLSCQTRYRGVFGRLTSWASQREALMYFGAGLPSLHRQRHELRLITPGRDLKLLRFSQMGADERRLGRVGDRLSILYSSVGSGMEKLVAIHNHTLGRGFPLTAPVPSLGYLLRTRGVVAIAILGGAVFGGVPLGVVSLGAIALALSTRLMNAAALTTPELCPQDAQEARLLADLKLLQQKFKLETRVSDLRHDLQQHQGLIRQLQALRGKMMALNANLYAGRVDSLERGMRLLRQRIEHNQRLIDEYGEMIQMLEVELEASSLADQLPEADDFTHKILSRLDELAAIEAENETLRLQIEASAELRQHRRV